MPTTLAGRNKEMIFARIRTLIKALQEQRIPGIRISDGADSRFTDYWVRRGTSGDWKGRQGYCSGKSCEDDE
jgi:hypothetical protein